MSHMRGSSILQGSATVPGVQIPEEIRVLLPDIFKACRDFGLDFYPTVIQFLNYDEISEVAAYGGFPVRFPHWKWGMEYEGLATGYEYGMHRIYEMVINCLHPDTMVLTNRGTVPASHVKEGDHVCLGKDFRKVVATKSQRSSDTKRIKIQGYLHDLICTDKHKWKVLSETGLVWKESKDIKQGDLLIGSDNQSYSNKPKKINWGKAGVFEETNINVQHCLKEINPPNEMTLQLAELLGVLTGDGSIGVIGNENDIIVSIGNDPSLDNYVKHVQDLFFTVFEAETVVHQKSGGRIVMLQSKYAVDYLDYIGLKKGVTYKNKRVPKSVLESSQEYRAAYLRGLFDTDGYATDVLGLSAYNKNLIADVQLLLTEMGIVSRAETVENGIGINGDIKKITTLDIFGKPSLERFRDKIGFILDYKNVGLESLINTEFCRGGGAILPFIQNKIIDWAKTQGITTYNNASLGRSIKNMERSSVGFNCLYSFAERALLSAAYSFDSEILNLLRTPFFVVESVEDGDPCRTVDIALDHDDHDFIANGLVTHNTNPCYIYCLNSNTLVDNITVIAHATGHNDFFKNNIHFEPTSQNMLNELANHGTRIRRYMSRWGKEKVTQFIDYVLRLETLVDPAAAWKHRKVKQAEIMDTREHRHPKRIEVPTGHDYMENWINPKSWRDKQNEENKRKDVADELDLFQKPTRDILGYLRDNAPLKPWQADIVAMLHEEALYFAPQRSTKMMNEGWASFVDHNIMAAQGFVSLGRNPGAGIVEYAQHKAGVLGGKYSLNPYKIGMMIFKDVEERWNKGQFGDDWDNCTNMEQKLNWDLNLNKGREKVFELRRYYDDISAIMEFFTDDFCNKHEFFDWEQKPDGDYVIASRDPEVIRKKLMLKYLNGGLPDIRLVDPNHRGKGWFLLQHQWDGRPLYDPYVKETISSIAKIWRNTVVLATKDDEGDAERICVVDPNGPIAWMTREEFENLPN